MKNNLKLLMLSFIITLTLATPQQSHATDVERPFVSRAYLASLGLDFPELEAIYYSTPRLHDYQKFLDGKLIYKDPESGNEVELKFSDLPNPLKGTFDLSECGDTSKYLAITTDPSFGAAEVNKDKFVILITLCSLVKKQINSSASHFEPIIGEWNEESAPVGIFWRWGNWQDLMIYDYLTTLSPDDLSSKSLFGNWLMSAKWTYAFNHSVKTLKAHNGQNLPDERRTLKFTHMQGRVFHVRLCKPK